MSAMQQLRDSGLFNERDPQRNGSVCFQVKDAPRGASIYVTANERELHIRYSPLGIDKFPNNQRLHDFIQEHTHNDAVHGEGNPARSYALHIKYVYEVIMIIRDGV